MKQNKLWDKNFTIITIGTIISSFGSAVNDFALGMLILDKTGSTFLYSLFFIAAVTPKMFVPMIAGPFIDRFSRRKIIYMLDFIISFLFLFLAVLCYFNYFNYIFYLCVAVVAGSISSLYQVTYDSFYPMLISEGNYYKAYSVSSLIYPLASTIMVPVAAIVYEGIGLYPLFLFNFIAHIFAAGMEMCISIKESQVLDTSINKFNFIDDFKEGINYLKEEKGLFHITLYFAISAVTGAVIQTLFLPFFESSPQFTTTQYSIVMSTQTLGRIIGGIIQYKLIYPTDKKFKIAVFVYTIVCFFDMIFFFSPYSMMLVIYLIYGVLGVTSYNIRTSATQSYVPNEKRGRFNSIFLVITSLGSVIGQFIGGALGEFIYIPYIIVAISIINLIFVYVFVVRNKEDISLIYNRDI